MITISPLRSVLFYPLLRQDIMNRRPGPQKSHPDPQTHSESPRFRERREGMLSQILKPALKSTCQ